MYPELQIGDIVITQKNDDYNIGEIITFNVNKQYLITHRIVGKQEGGFITKGDNNNTEDIEKVIKEDIEGKVIYNLKILRKFN